MTRTVRLHSLLVAAGLLLISSSLEAQIGGRIRQQVQNRVNRQVDEAVERTLDRVECTVTDRQCIEKAQAEGREVRVTDAQGNDVVGGAAAALRPGQGAWANYDFVPGERVLFADDFAADRVGNFPQRLEFLQGNIQVVEWQGRRWLQATSKSAFAIPLPETLPSQFTMEFDVTLPHNGLVVTFADRGQRDSRFLYNGSWPHPFVVLANGEVGLRQKPHTGGSVVDPAATLGVRQPHGELVRLRIHGDGRYVKVYLNEHRVANIPNADLPRADRIYIETTGFPPPGPNTSYELTPTLIGSITVNAGGRTLYDALAADGRVVTQGIFFDTGSDQIRPESTPTLREIADMLRQHSELRLGIEGHTDNTGSAATNKTLSEQRAAAVKAFLVANHGIDAARLETRGFGPDKPLMPNDTPEGRQNNRRVELVKQ
jgi:OmpA-OmpF porin, OOP family